MNRDTDIMARTIYGEARGEYYVKDGGINSLIAVGNVIMNRSIERSRSISSICLILHILNIKLLTHTSFFGHKQGTVHFKKWSERFPW